MARLPNVPTVWSNVWTAWVLAMDLDSPTDNRWSGFWWLILGATLIYAGGVIFCEVCDVEFDRKFRPERPLPAGRVTRGLAASTGVLCCLIGGEIMRIGAASTVFVLVLLVAIFCYAVLHKRAPWLAVILMGLCRPILVFNVMLAWWLGRYSDVLWTPDYLEQGYMVVLGFYVCSISWMALGEVKVWRRRAVGMMLAALPLVDALFLAMGQHYAAVIVPVGCMGLAIALRKVAAAT
jgi:4-hydroxybenzoate polyprenyltransferase